MLKRFYILYSLIFCSSLMVFPSAVIKPLDASCVKLSDSPIKDRESLNMAFIDSIDPDRLLHNFRVNAGLPSDALPLGGWEAPKIGLRGHFVGHYLSALAKRYRNSGDKNVKRRLDYMVDVLKQCQDKIGTGRLTAFHEKDFETLESRFSGVWAPYYTYHKMMQGLYDAYALAGNKKAYGMLLRMAEYVAKRMDKLDSSTLEKLLDTTAANPANEAGAMNEVIYKLYSLTGDDAYLRLAQKFDPQWFLKTLSENSDILAGLHSNTHLVLVNGFAARYDATGDTLYRNAVINFWNMLSSHHSYVNGTSSGPRPNPTTKTSLTAEHWTYPDCLACTFSKEIAESCVTHNTRKLLAYLFEWTGDAKYAEADMNLFYNGVLPIQSGEGDYVYHLPLGSPRQKKYLKKDDFMCCSGSSAEAFMQLYQGAYYHDDNDNLWINLYIPSEINWNGVTITQSTDFPYGQDVKLIVNSGSPRRFRLNLLKPSWANGVTVSVNGDVVASVSEGAANYVVVDRKWKDGDVVSMSVPSVVRVHHLPGNDKVVAFLKGASLLAFEGNKEIVLKGEPDEIARQIVVADNSKKIFKLRNNGQDYILRPFSDIDRQSYSVYATISDY